MRYQAFKNFFGMEAAGGIVLFAAAVVAEFAANSPLQGLYEGFLNLTMQIRIGPLDIGKPLLLWINDGLMAVFFLLVGLEIKREFKAGALSSGAQAILPAVAAVGGMIVPALIYVLINLGGEPENLNGWAIPAATDIAFALGVLTLLGSRVPLVLKVLLTAIAIFDDLGAILIIAVFYTAQLSLVSLGAAVLALAVLLALNLAGVTRKAPYILVGIILWICVLKSGVHATLAGVALAMMIPLAGKTPDDGSPLREMEHELHPWVAFGVLPIFAFANAGVSFAGVGLSSLVEPVTLGIALGLFLGKPIGVYGTIWLANRLGVLRLPGDVSRMQLFGVSILCGIGFTMSLFIGGLAWEHADFDAPVRLGVIAGSIASALLGSLVLLAAPRPRAEAAPAADAGPPAPSVPRPSSG